MAWTRPKACSARCGASPRRDRVAVPSSWRCSATSRRARAFSCLRWAAPGSALATRRASIGPNRVVVRRDRLVQQAVHDRPGLRLGQGLGAVDEQFRLRIVDPTGEHRLMQAGSRFTHASARSIRTPAAVTVQASRAATSSAARSRNSSRPSHRSPAGGSRNRGASNAATTATTPTFSSAS